jgi:Protein of unknown function (DUF2924)/GIY-YIG catalytic domain
MRKKRTNLVCQHMENVSARVLEQYQDIIRENFRGRHGIYALYRRDKLYYVGLASNLRNRLRQHLADKHKGLWDRFSVYLTIEDHHMKELESMVLRIVKPKGNSQIGRFPKSQDLKRQLQKEVRRRQREEWGALFGRPSGALRDVTNGTESASETVLGRYLHAPLKLRREYKGEMYKANVRQNGWIWYGGYLYSSPSLPASEICGRRVNGWYFWRFEKAPNYWVPLKNLRS